MRKQEFKEILEEYISDLEKDYYFDIKGNSNHSGKTSGYDHNWPDNIDHQKPELSICCLAMDVNCNLPDEMWSIRPAFALR